MKTVSIVFPFARLTFAKNYNNEQHYLPGSRIHCKPVEERYS